MMKVSCTLLLLVLVGFVMNGNYVNSSLNKNCEERGSIKCNIGGELKCAKLCSNGTSECDGVDVNDERMCSFFKDCPLTSTFVVKASETALVANCNDLSGGGSCRIVCFGSCAGTSSSCSSDSKVPTGTGCTSPACEASCLA